MGDAKDNLTQGEIKIGEIQPIDVRLNIGKLKISSSE